MCGIAGYCQLEGKLSFTELEKMTDALQRRGPDDSGYFVNDNVGLGMRRLSIIDIEHGQQPVCSQSGRYKAVFNGEIYNFKALRAELTDKGFNFSSEGDAEVIVNLFEHEGVSAINRLRGMFAIAIWDNINEELILIRDQLGIKPVFYNVEGNSLIFGSEIKALLQVMPEKLDVDAQSLDALFAYTYIPAPLSIWKDIRKLRPGHFLKWRNGKVEEHRYWDLLDAIDGDKPNTVDIQEGIDDAIDAHLVSDVEVGAFLSGGLDSSTIVSRMQRRVSKPIHALSLRFNSPGHLFDETTYAEELRLVCGFNLDVHSLDPSNYSSAFEAIRAFDEPFADDSIVPSMAISEFAAQDLKVVLSGAGGDEIFGGYNRYQGVALHQLTTRIPGLLRKIALGPIIKFLGGVAGAGTRKGDLLRRFAASIHASPDEAYLAYITAASPEQRRKMMKPQISEKIESESTRNLLRQHQLRGAALSPVKRAMYVDFNTYLPEDVLALSDRVGMWHSLEIRTPLADRILAETAFRLPVNELATSRSKKIALRRATSDWLPQSILNHPKQGFEGPTANWLRGPGEKVFGEAMDKDAKNGNSFINHHEIEQLLQEHVAGNVDHSKRLFTALSLMYWTSINSHRIGGVA